MRYEAQEVFLAPVTTRGGTHLRVFDSRGDAVRAVNGQSWLVERKKVIPSSGRGAYRKPYVPAKKRAKKV